MSLYRLEMKNDDLMNNPIRELVPTLSNRYDRVNKTYHKLPSSTNTNRVSRLNKCV